MDATIRPASREDAEVIADVHNRSRADAFRGHIDDEILLGDSTFALVQFWRDHFAAADPNGTVFVAEIGSKMVGFAYVHEAEAPYELELQNLYLLPEAAGTGLAPELMAAVLPEGVPALLWVADFNERAQRFYRKEGFEFDGAEKFYEPDQITLKRMVRPE